MDVAFTANSYTHTYFFFFFFTDTATTDIYTLSLHDALPICNIVDFGAFVDIGVHQDGLVHISEMADRYIRHPLEVLKPDRKSTRLNSSHVRISYAVFCLKKKKK